MLKIQKGDDMMKIDLFQNAKNVEFTGTKFLEEVGAELPVFTLTDIPVDRWNEIAKECNTKSFVTVFGKQPKDYEEVLDWVYSLRDKAKEKAKKYGSFSDHS